MYARHSLVVRLILAIWMGVGFWFATHRSLIGGVVGAVAVFVSLPWLMRRAERRRMELVARGPRTAEEEKRRRRVTVAAILIIAGVVVFFAVL